MTTITARPQPEQGRILIEVGSPPVGVVVERNDGKGYLPRRYAVVLDSPTDYVVADYEAPTDRPVAYRVAPSGPAYGPLTLPSDGATWWKPLPFPALSMKVNVLEALSSAEADTETVDLFPLGSSAPITVYGVRRMWKGSVTVATLTSAEGARFNDGLSKSPIVLLQPPNGADQTYLSIGKVSRAATLFLGNQERWWSMEAQQRSAPVVDWKYAATATWGGYKNAGATWEQWRSGTWIDVLSGSV